MLLARKGKGMVSKSSLPAYLELLKHWEGRRSDYEQQLLNFDPVLPSSRS